MSDRVLEDYQLLLDYPTLVGYYPNLSIISPQVSFCKLLLGITGRLGGLWVAVLTIRATWDRGVLFYLILVRAK